MKKKKLLSALLAGVMAVTLTACGGNSASTEGSTSAASGSTASTASAASGSTSTASGSTSSATETPVDGGQLIIGLFFNYLWIYYELTILIYNYSVIS